MSLLVTRQYVEVLVSPTGGAQTYEVSVTSTLAFSETNGIAKAASVTDSLEFVDEAIGAASKVVKDTLALTDSASCVRIISNTHLFDTLAFTDSAEWLGPHYFQLKHVLPFVEDPYGHLSVINLSVNDLLVFVESMPKVFEVSVTDTLILGSVGIKKDAVTSTMALTETINAGKGKDVTDALALTETVDLLGMFWRTVSHNLGLVNSAAFQFTSLSCAKKQFQPQVGFTTDTGVLVPSGIVPSLPGGILTLTFPYVSPTTTLVLRNPEFGNKDSLNFNRINRTTRGGELIVYSDPQWPKTQKLALEVRSLVPSQAANLLTFFDQSLGLEIGLLDQEGRQWRGIITNPDTPIINPERGDYAVSFEFEGVLC
jgi:hypothetical protein